LEAKRLKATMRMLVIDLPQSLFSLGTFDLLLPQILSRISLFDPLHAKVLELQNLPAVVQKTRKRMQRLFREADLSRNLVPSKTASVTHCCLDLPLIATSSEEHGCWALAVRAAAFM